ncbi:Methylphosphotriester-DNA--protein-cysteine S-methyltransferase [Actinomyces howellii]|uniref:Methylphosphotriester-DNA--protein-cysteine S-methyltransferase n=1 Tax=Actinomyces howellii TaxID=52771 RepID=A0A448HGZ3_9ACTO|nr:Methylphosphotriester-DNA--protein-cysteine S-methyltransferase [Actinomyces howellii]
MRRIGATSPTPGRGGAPPRSSLPRATVAPGTLELVARATAFLREHHRQPLSVRDLADHLCYSPSHLTRTFTAVAGVSPIGYLSAWRLHEAKRLLLLPGVGVAEACYEVGYTSVGTFSRRFTRDVGLAPGALRRAADRLAESSLPPVSLLAPADSRVVVRLTLPAALRPALGPSPYQWVGTFPTPAATGPPATGTLRRGLVEVEVPVVAGAPWLLALLVPDGAGVNDHLAPDRPLVARHPRPLRPDAASDPLVLEVEPALPWDPPALVALAALWPG